MEDWPKIVGIVTGPFAIISAWFYRHVSSGKHADPNKVVYKDVCDERSGGIKATIDDHSKEAARRYDEILVRIDKVYEEVRRQNGR